MLLEQAVDNFLEYFISIGNSPETSKLYESTLTRMTKHLGNCELDHIDSDDLEDWFEEMCEEEIGRDQRPRKPGTMRAYWSAMRSFFSWAGLFGYIDERPDGLIEAPSGEDEIVLPLRRVEFVALIRASEKVISTGSGLLENAILLVLLDTGIRAGELCRLKVKDINFINHTLYVRSHNVSGRKTKARYIPITSQTLAGIQLYLEARGRGFTTDPLFLSSDGYRFSRHTLRNLLMRIGKRASVRGVTTHRFRHTFATEFLRNNGYYCIQELRYLLGHATEEVVIRYLELSRADSRASHARGSLVANGMGK